MSPLAAFTIALAVALALQTYFILSRLIELQNRITTTDASLHQLHATLADHTRRVAAIARRVQSLLDQQKKPATKQPPPETNLPFPL